MRAASDTVAHGPRVRLLLGGCTFTGIFDCPCLEGSAIELIKDIQQDILCERCGHSMMMHKEHDDSTTLTYDRSRPRIKPELLDNGSRDDIHQHAASLPPRETGSVDVLPEVQEEICQRSDTVLAIAKLLAEGESVFIWGGQGAGKSTLAKLLFDMLDTAAAKAILIPCWPRAARMEDILLDGVKKKYPSMNFQELSNENLIFIIDEAQESLKTTRARGIWHKIMEQPTSTGCRPRFCIISNQGVLPEPHNVFSAMPEISHLITHGNGDGTLSLFFTAAEFVEYFQKNRICYGFNLDEQAVAEVYSVTAGHPTLVSLVLRYVRLHVIQKTANTPQSTMLTITKSDLLAITHDEDRLFNCLGDKIYPGSYARDSKVVVNMFRKLLQAPDGKIGWESAARSTIEKCFLNNLIVHEIDQTPPHAEGFRFPSPLHARWAQWYHHIETGVYAGELTP